MKSSYVTTGFSVRVRGSGLNGFSVRVRGSVTTGLTSVGPLSDCQSILPRRDPVIGAFKVGVSLIGSFLAAGFLSKSLSVTGILKVISPE